MKKKILAMVLSLAMCCSMTACGSANKDTATSDGASSDKKAASKNDNGSDLAYIQDKGTLIVGITDFEPMDYKDKDGNWIGFDADMAKMAADPATQRWWDVVKPRMAPLPDRAEGEFWSDMEEIYHLN